MKSQPSFSAYNGPAGGWGSVGSLRRSLTKEHVPISGSRVLLHQNKPDGYACVSCAWAKPAEPHPFEFCEEGAKATSWEITRRRAEPEFFAEHSCAELETWSDHDLEAQGRLTHPLRWDAATDRYLPVEWDQAMAEIGTELKALDPKKAVFYSSGRASLEASYMYALFARLYGNNNLPDSSNMCHESTSVGLPLSIGVPVGTVTLDDFKKTGCILFFGHNTGISSPRMLHDLQECAQRDVPIIIFNPLRERGFERFTNPQNPVEMLTGSSTPISSQYHQIKVGGDKAALMGLCKAVLALDKLDRAFIAEHTHGFDEFAAAVNAAGWDEIEKRSGLSRAAIEAAAEAYANAETAMIAYGMGLTQQIGGVENVQMVVNLLLLRGNMGKPGAGVLPVRGHSNVQGQRTVGITEKPKLVPLDKLKEQYGFEPPQDKGLNATEACEGIIKGDVRAMVQLGGNLVRSLPDHGQLVPAWRKMRLTVQILTKPNRSCLVHGEVSYILPCLGRIEMDRQASGMQAVSMEDSTACIHGSRGVAEPASEHLRSEPWIVAALAKATLPPNPKIDWDGWVADYARIRDAIAETYPKDFHDLDKRMWEPGGFHRPLPARQREWKTESGKANFIVPKALSGNIDTEPEDPNVLQLTTFRSQGQFNTTIYSDRDRFRGVEGTRMVAFMNKGDLDRMGLAEGATVSLVTAIDDGVHRQVDHFIVRAYDIPAGCIGAYYPECNPLVPVSHHAEGSFVPAVKGIPVRVIGDGGRQEITAHPGVGAVLETAGRQPVITVLAVAAGFLIGSALVRRK
ncbi:MAG TPA: FdhF/YdeP family oxidoreductase [Stellaceae bacterium]|nr:FdhF/YdeP family oxidoreductase [Stellaceae bacterium]